VTEKSWFDFILLQNVHTGSGAYPASCGCQIMVGEVGRVCV